MPEPTKGFDGSRSQICQEHPPLPPVRTNDVAVSLAAGLLLWFNGCSTPAAAQPASAGEPRGSEESSVVVPNPGSARATEKGGPCGPPSC